MQSSIILRLFLFFAGIMYTQILVAKPDSLFVLRRGEYLRMNIHYTIFDAGTLEIMVDTAYHTVDSKRCLKVSVTGKTTGALGLLAYVNDLWTSYLDSATLKPYQFNRVIKENSFEKEEMTVFDRDLQAAIVTTQEGKSKYYVETYPVTENIHDMVSGYLALRKFDFNSIKKNDTIIQKIFLEDKVYTIKFKYIGKKHLRTKIGRHKAIILSPILPENRLFDNGEAITIWMSDDAYRIPLKLQGKLFIGAVEADIAEFNGYDRKRKK
jgi:hypothetical protein